MNPQRKERVDDSFEAQPETLDPGQEVLLEIANDARRLKGRYLRETVVPEGGE